MSATGLKAWYQAVEAARPEAIAPLLVPEATFESPIVHTPQHGRAITAKYLQAALSLLNNAQFRYVGEWRAERSAVLEFETEIEGVRVNGVDMIWWDENDQITRFKVMIRPLKAINLVHQKMGELLAKAG